MKVTLIPGRELGPDLVLTWARLRQSNPDLASPYFHPEFTRIIAAVRDDVEVAIVEDGGKPVVLFPFQRGFDDVGGPVGGTLSDYQGVICAPDFTCDPRAMLKSCSLVAWEFDHLIASQRSFAAFYDGIELSPQLDLSHGFTEYAKDRRAAGSEQIKKCGNAMRRMARDVGPLQFVAHAADELLLRRTLMLKSRQYLASGKIDLFSRPWIRAAVERIHALQTNDFAGMLSLLYSGEQLVAAHFGMRGRSTWHYWFPAYEPRMATYSPGLILLLKIAEYAATIGVRTIDLGKGMSLYKARLMNASVPLASGTVELSSWRAVRQSARRKLRALVTRSPLDEPVRGALSTLKELRARIMR
jgi:CelD/BcsL family acetyltransferase involved in cellulose biosynthesis